MYPAVDDRGNDVGDVTASAVGDGGIFTPKIRNRGGAESAEGGGGDGGGALGEFLALPDLSQHEDGDTLPLLLLLAQHRTMSSTTALPVAAANLRV